MVPLVKANLDVLPETAAVVVPGGLSISNSLDEKGRGNGHVGARWWRRRGSTQRVSRRAGAAYGTTAPTGAGVKDYRKAQSQGVIYSYRTPLSQNLNDSVFSAGYSELQHLNLTKSDLISTSITDACSSRKLFGGGGG